MSNNLIIIINDTYTSNINNTLQVADRLCEIANRSDITDETIDYSLVACMKLVAQMQNTTPSIDELLEKHVGSQSIS